MFSLKTLHRQCEEEKIRERRFIHEKPAQTKQNEDDGLATFPLARGERERDCIILAILLKNDDRDVNDADSQKVFVCEIRSLLRRVGLFIQVACICSGRTTKYNNKKENNCKGLILVALFDNKMAMSMPGGSILLQYRAFF